MELGVDQIALKVLDTKVTRQMIEAGVSVYIARSTYFVDPEDIVLEIFETMLRASRDSCRVP